MSKKNKIRETENDSLVYTTSEEGNSFFSHLALNNDLKKNDQDALVKNDMRIRVTRDKKNRGGKEVTLIIGLELPEEQLQDLAKTLKSKCGVGGAAKDGEIMIQGNHVDKVIDLLKKEGYKDVKRTGG